MNDKNHSLIETELSLPALATPPIERKVVKLSPAPKSIMNKPTMKLAPKPKEEITDSLFLDTVRNDVYAKLRSGELTLTLADGFKAIDLKQKLSSPDSEDRVASLFAELRRELMKLKSSP